MQCGWCRFQQVKQAQLTMAHSWAQSQIRLVRRSHSEACCSAAQWHPPFLRCCSSSPGFASAHLQVHRFSVYAWQPDCKLCCPAAVLCLQSLLDVLCKQEHWQWHSLLCGADTTAIVAIAGLNSLQCTCCSASHVLRVIGMHGSVHVRKVVY